MREARYCRVLARVCWSTAATWRYVFLVSVLQVYEAGAIVERLFCSVLSHSGKSLVRTEFVLCGLANCRPLPATQIEYDIPFNL